MLFRPGGHASSVFGQQYVTERPISSVVLTKKTQSLCSKRLKMCKFMLHYTQELIDFTERYGHS